jgi:3-hydroxybutyryl-CoA dehydrogenase
MSFQWITPYSVRIAVAGAGTMGSGIALAALLADIPVTLFDISPEMLDRASAYIQSYLERKNKAQNLVYLTQTVQLEELVGANVVIEAIPEDLKLKQDLFRRLDGICPPPAILATNTSTLPVTTIAAATAHPGRVAGMHFFNPAPVLPLVEVVPAAQSRPETVQTLLTLAEKLGKTAVVATDTPGFIVNRVARPFYGEALRLLGDGIATHEQIDQIVRLGAGFRMGPFQLMDLIGIDVNLAAMRLMFEQTFGEARYRPHPIQVRMVAQNSLGRKTGKGFYDYTGEPASEPTIPKARQCNEMIILGAGSWAPGLSEVAHKAGYKVQNGGYTQETFYPKVAILPAGRKESLRKKLIEMDILMPASMPILCQTADVTLTEAATWIERPERLVGFDGLFFAGGHIATLVASPTLTLQARLTMEGFITSLGRLPLWIQDSPALVLPRVVGMLINEAAFAVQEGVASADHIDLAMQLGVSYPHGLLTWAKEIGYAHVVDVLDHLYNEFRDERYRAAYLLRRWARLEQVKG